MFFFSLQVPPVICRVLIFTAVFEYAYQLLQNQNMSLKYITEDNIKQTL